MAGHARVDANKAQEEADKEVAEAVKAKNLSDKEAQEAGDAKVKSDKEDKEAKAASKKAEKANAKADKEDAEAEKSASKVVKAWCVGKARSVTSLRGIIGPGEAVSPEDFFGGKETMADLEKRGVIEFTDASGG